MAVLVLELLDEESEDDFDGELVESDSAGFDEELEDSAFSFDPDDPVDSFEELELSDELLATASTAPARLSVR